MCVCLFSYVFQPLHVTNCFPVSTCHILFSSLCMSHTDFQCPNASYCFPLVHSFSSVPKKSVGCTASSASAVLGIASQFNCCSSPVPFEICTSFSFPATMRCLTCSAQYCFPPFSTSHIPFQVITRHTHFYDVCTSRSVFCSLLVHPFGQSPHVTSCLQNSQCHILFFPITACHIRFFILCMS